MPMRNINGSHLRGEDATSKGRQSGESSSEETVREHSPLPGPGPKVSAAVGGAMKKSSRDTGFSSPTTALDEEMLATGRSFK